MRIQAIQNQPFKNQPAFSGWVSYTPKMPPIFDGADTLGAGYLQTTSPDVIDRIYTNLYKLMEKIIPLKDIKEIKGFKKVKPFKLGDDIITLATDPAPHYIMGNEIEITHGKDGCYGKTIIHRRFNDHKDPEFDELAQALDKKPMPN